MNFQETDNFDELNVTESISSLLENQAILDSPESHAPTHNALVIGIFAVGCIFIAILIKAVCSLTLKNKINKIPQNTDIELPRTPKSSRASGVSSILELAEANSLIPQTPEPDLFFGLRKSLEDVRVNQLSFPGVDGHFDFDNDDMHFICVIETTEENVVKKYHHKPTKRNMAVKIIRIPLSKTEIFDLNAYVALLKNEVILVQVISRCSNIVNFYGIAMLDGEILFCMELMDWSLKEIYKKIHKERKKFPEELLGYVTVASLDALIYCRSNGIVRFDVKPTTILVNRRGHIKLCDFAGSRVHDAPLSTWIYWPPEFFLNSNINLEEQIAVWSLGLTLLEASLGRLPFKDYRSINSPNSKFIPEFIIKTNFEDIINHDIKEAYSPTLCDFLRTCLSEYRKRPLPEKMTSMALYRLYTQTFSRENVARLLMRHLEFDHVSPTQHPKEFLKQVL